MRNRLLYITFGVLLVISSLLVDILGYEDLSSILELTIVPVLTVIYFVKAKIKAQSFVVFITLYSVGDVAKFFDLHDTYSMTYYICNSFFIISYVFLIFYIINTINFNDLLKSYKLELFILSVLIGYMIYVLIKIIRPESFEAVHGLSVQVFELLYNLLLILLLTISFLNYIQNTNKKHLYLFFACVLIVLSELIFISFYYINKDMGSSSFYPVLYVSGFLLLFNQSQMKNTKTLFLSK